MAKYLITIETVKIKDFIFNTNKLKVIRGASYLLDYLNQVEMRKILKNFKISEEEWLCVAAGKTQFQVDSLELAEDIIKNIKKTYRDFAPGAKIVASKIEVDSNKLIWNAIDELAEETAKEKSKGFPVLNIDLPFMEKCCICNDKPVEVKNGDRDIVEKFESLYDNVGEYKTLNEVLGVISDTEKFKNRTEGICVECLAKLIAATYIKDDQQKVGIYHKRAELTDFISGDTIEDYSGKKSFIGFVYADGDSLGDFLKNAKNNYVSQGSDGEKNYKKFMKEFSEELDKRTKNAFIETLKDLKKKGVLPEFTNKMGEKGTLYGEFLIVGGDDVCAIFPAEVALKVSTLFQKKFEKSMIEFDRDLNNKEDSGNNITASSGVVIAKNKTPLHYLFNQSITLQKLAKAKRYQDFKDKKNDIKKGYIDFQVIGGEGTTDIKVFREAVENLIERPYMVDAFRGGSIKGNGKIKDIDTLVELIDDLNKVKFPKNKIRKFYELKKEGESRENLFEFVNLGAKLDENSRKVLFEKWIDEDIDKIEFNKILPNIFDVLEVFDYVDGGK